MSASGPSAANGSGYVPFAGGDRVLERLALWAADEIRPVVILAGPRGSGKTTLLSVFAARSAPDFRIARLSDPRVDPDALSLRILDELGVDADETRPRSALVRAIQGVDGPPLLLLIDDADALSPRSEMWLFDLVRRSAAGLRVVLVVAEPRVAGELSTAFGAGTEVIPTDTPMSRSEVDRFVRAECARRGGPTLLLDDEILAGVHARSRGLPGRVREETIAALAELEREERARAAAPPAIAVAEAHPAAAREHVAAALLPPAPRAALPPREIASPPPAPGARREPTQRDSLLRWLLLPGALASMFVAGFLASELLQVVRARPSLERPRLPIAVAPPVAAAPSADELPPVAAAPPPGAVAQSPSEPASPTPAEGPAPAAAPPIASPPTVSGAAAPTAAAADSQTADAPAPQAAAAEVRPAAPPAQAAAEPPAAPASEPASVEPSAGAPAGSAESPSRVRTRMARASTPRPVSVRLSAEPGAEIRVDGQSLGAAPVGQLELPSGPHHFVVTLPDGRVAERVVDVQGKQYDVRFR